MQTQNAPADPDPEADSDPNFAPSDGGDDDDDADLFPESPDPSVQPVANSGVDPVVQLYTNILGFSPEVANSLAYEQQLDTPSAFLDLTEDNIDSICQAIHKPGGANQRRPQVAIISVTQLKLFAFYVKINWHMSHPQADFANITKHHLDLVKEQWTIELEYLQAKDNPDPKPMTLDLMSAPACFKKVKVILGSMRRSTGNLLQYVI